MAHYPVVTKRTGPVHYSGKSYSDRFACSKCERARRFNLNFLGGRAVVCDGEKFHRVEVEFVDGKPTAIMSVGMSAAYLNVPAGSR